MSLDIGFQPFLMLDNGFQLVSLLLKVIVVEVEELGKVPKGAMEGQLSFHIGVGLRFL